MSMSQPELEVLLRKTVLLYNRIKSPEVISKLVFVSPISVTISFSGGFCYGRGILDYVEAFASQFKVLSGKLELKLAKTREISSRTFEADFTLKLK